MTSNRRTTSDGYPRGEDTRARVIESALRLFGQRGFDGASTRDIALDAGVNAPSLQYYFSSKEGLYLACVQHMVARLWSYVSEPVKVAERLLVLQVGDAELIDAYCTIQEHTADFMFSSKEPSDWLLIIMRDQAGLGPDAGFEFMYKEVNMKFLAINSAIVGRLMNLPPGAEETRVRAMTLSGQLLVFLFLRRTLLKALHWDQFRGERVELIKRIVRENTRELLTAISQQRHASTAPPMKKKTKNLADR